MYQGHIHSETYREGSWNVFTRIFSVVVAGNRWFIRYESISDHAPEDRTYSYELLDLSVREQKKLMMRFVGKLVIETRILMALKKSPDKRLDERVIPLEQLEETLRR